MLSGTQLRMTNQRKVILEELGKLKSHPTAGELCQIVRRRLPRISLGTVYRNLEILSSQGVIQKLTTGGSEMRFDGNAHPHYHQRCVVCGRVDDLEMAPDPELERRLAQATHYQVLGHRLELLGYCPSCQQQRPLASRLGES